MLLGSNIVSRLMRSDCFIINIVHSVGSIFQYIELNILKVNVGFIKRFFMPHVWNIVEALDN